MRFVGKADAAFSIADLKSGRKSCRDDVRELRPSISLSNACEGAPGSALVRIVAAAGKTSCPIVTYLQQPIADSRARVDSTTCRAQQRGRPAGLAAPTTVHCK
jgi:hypothetical protein